MDECEYNGKTYPASNKYDPNDYLTSKRTLGFNMGELPEKTHWKAKKKNKPDGGTYEPNETFKKAVSRRP